MTGTLVPGTRRLVTPGWIDHSSRRIGPTPFVTTKTFAALQGGKNAANTQFVVTNATGS
jgi:hypothetical protein